MENSQNSDFEKIVTLIHVESPSKFFVRTASQLFTFERLSKAIKAYYDYPPDENEVKIFRVSDLENADCKLVVKYKGNYRRAYLKEKLEYAVKVYFMDFVEIVVVPLHQCFRPIEEVFFRDEPCVTRCHLSDVQPYGSYEDDWSLKAVQFFSEKVSAHRSISLLERGLEVMTVDGEPSLPVDIVLHESTADNALSRKFKVVRYMSQLLIKENLGRYLKDISGDIFSENAEQDLRHVTVSDEDSFLAPEPVKRWPDPVFPSKWMPGETRRIRVTQIDASGQIYAHYSSDRYVLDHMDNFFTTVYGSTANEALFADKTIKTNWQVNEDCVVFQVESKTWNRGRITKCHKLLEGPLVETHFSVLLVDHGVEIGGPNLVERVTSAQLRVPFYFGDVPIITQRFVLEGIVPEKTDVDTIGFTWPQEVVSFMFDKTYMDNDIGKSVYARKTRFVYRFPIPVTIKVKLRHYREKTDLAEMIMTNSFLASASLSLMRYDWPDLVYQSDVFLTRAFNIDAQRPQVTECDNAADDLPDCPFELPTLPEIVPEGALLPVTVTTIWNNRFCIHFKNQDVKNVSAILMEEAPKEPPVPLEPGVKVSCLVADAWYRGYILSISKKDGDTTASVFLVDCFVIESDVIASNLRNIPESVCNLPILAFVCTLSTCFTKDMHDVLFQLASVETTVYFSLVEQTDEYNVIGEIYIGDREDVNIEPHSGLKSLEHYVVEDCFDKFSVVSDGSDEHQE